ncbi:hypothetical protein GCM10009552_43260 [Rothia nasimurium]
MNLFFGVGTPEDALAKYGCRKMDQEFYASHIDEARRFFHEKKPAWTGKTDEAPGIICTKDAEIYVDAKPEFNNAGYHWTVSIDMKTGEMSIIEGL